MRQLFAGAFQTAFWERQNHLSHRIYFLEKERRLELMELLRESIEHGFAGFSVAYQPGGSGHREAFGAEALGKDGPAESMAAYRREMSTALERSGLINQLADFQLCGPPHSAVNGERQPTSDERSMFPTISSAKGICSGHA